MEKSKRKELEDKLFKVLPAINDNREMKDSIKQYYIEKNMSSSVPMRIINKDTILSMLTDVDLCMLVKAINTINNPFKLDITYYFNSTDIELADAYKKDKLEKDNVVIFHDVDQTNEKIWVCSKITFQEIVELSGEKKIGYNFNTQREGKKILKGNEIVTIPTVNKKAITDMMNMWKLGTFVPNMITFNIEDPLDIEYNPVNRTLKITLNENDYLSIIDGYHRSIAAINIMQNDPTFKFGFYYLRILNFTEYEAQQFIIQEDKHTPINQEHLRLMDIEDASARVSKYICNYGSERTNPLFHKFTIKKDELNLDKYCLYSSIAFPLKTYFHLNTLDISKVNEIRGVVLRGLIYITSEIFPNEFKNCIKSRRNSVVTMNGTFVLYISLIAKLYEKGYHKQINVEDETKMEDAIKNILSKISFGFDNPEWRQLKVIDEENNMIVKKISLPDCKRISNYIDKVSQLEMEAI